MGALHNVPASKFEIHQLCDVCGGRHGRPRILNPGNFDVSWSHDQGVVAAGVGPGRIGVDVLVATGQARTHDLHLARPQLPGTEAMTQVEALVKAGTGTLDNLLREAAERGTPGSAEKVYLSDNNQRVVLKSASFDRVTVSVAGTSHAEFVMLNDLLAPGL